MQEVAGSIPVSPTRKEKVVAGAKSLGEALATGVPVVFTFKDRVPDVVCEPGKEMEALETLHKMGIINLMRPRDGKQPEDTLAPYGEQVAPVVERADTTGLNPVAKRHKGSTPFRSTR